jgi:hypothetical protein
MYKKKKSPKKSEASRGPDQRLGQKQECHNIEPPQLGYVHKKKNKQKITKPHVDLTRTSDKNMKCFNIY